MIKDYICNINDLNYNMKTKNTFLLTLIIISVIFSIGISIPPVSAYEIDIHYHFTFFLALYVGFSWDEAHLIASGNQRMDETGLVADGPVNLILNPLTPNPNNFEWHALNEDLGDKIDRLSYLKQRAFDEADINTKLVMFGQYLHYEQDLLPHNGYGSYFGHVIQGHEPDSPRYAFLNFNTTTFLTLYSLNDLLENLSRPQKTLNNDDIRPIIDDIYGQSDYYLVGNVGHDANRSTIEEAIGNLIEKEDIPEPPLIPDVIQGQFKLVSPDRGDPTGDW